MRTSILALGVCLASTVVYASDCEAMKKELDTALVSVELDETLQAKVEMLRARGEEERKAGNKLSCFVALEEALELLKS